jgi:hypothetical protein
LALLRGRMSDRRLFGGFQFEKGTQSIAPRGASHRSVRAGRTNLSFAKNMSMQCRFTFRENSPFACWQSFCVCFGLFDCWALGIMPVHCELQRFVQSGVLMP